ncbi:MAG: PaeR7I family type II restriction endonuclease [Syntrophales bacterium]|nr:PaeR7I family type II restriction endonuclease [Syntrophales bacterium]
MPGYFGPTKDWDLIVVADNVLLASIEFKAQVGSFGNNCNNCVFRSKSATDSD